MPPIFLYIMKAIDTVFLCSDIELWANTSFHLQNTKYFGSFFKAKTSSIWREKEGCTSRYIWGEKQKGGLTLVFISGYTVSKKTLLSKSCSW